MLPSKPTSASAINIMTLCWKYVMCLGYFNMSATYNRLLNKCHFNSDKLFLVTEEKLGIKNEARHI